MNEICTTKCIMEGRIQQLEKNYGKLLEQYSDDRVSTAQQMTGMRKDIETILKMLTDMNKTLTQVKEDQQKDEIEKAGNKNKAAARKWHVFSSETWAVIKGILLASIGVLIGYFLKG